MQEIMERIQNIMKQRKITARRLCEELGITEVNFTKWKNGRTGYLKHLPEIARILGCTVEYLTTGQETPAEIWYRKYLSASERDRKIIDLILE